MMNTDKKARHRLGTTIHFGAKILEVLGARFVAVAQFGDQAIVFDPLENAWAVAEKVTSQDFSEMKLFLAEIKPEAWCLTPYISVQAMKALQLLPADPAECYELQGFLQREGLT